MATDHTLLNRQLDTHTYMVYLYDVTSQNVVTTIPATSLSFGESLCDFGEAEIKLKVNPTTSRLGGLAKDLATGKRTIYIFRAGKLVWGGLLYEWTYTSSSRSLSVRGRTFEWYLFRRFQRITKEWKTATEQLEIARTLVSPALSDINASMGSGTSGIKRQINVYSYDFKTIGDRLDDLSNMINGFDWGFNLSVSPNNTISRTFNYWYPHKGKTKANTDIAFNYPDGAIIDYTYTNTLADASTDVYTLGAGEGNEMLVAKATKNDKTGFGTFEESYSYKDVKKQTTLQGHANARMAQKDAPIELTDVTVRANRDDAPTIGSFSVGDWAWFSIRDWMFPEGMKSYMRITEYTVKVDEDGLEEIDLTLNTERQQDFEDSGAASDG